MLTDRQKDEMKKRYAALQDGSEVYLVLRMDAKQPDTVWGTTCRNLVRELAENLRGMMVLRVDLSDEERIYLGQMAKEFSMMCKQLDGENWRERDLDEIRLLEERLHDLKTRLTDEDEPEEEDHEEITAVANEEFEKELKEEQKEEETETVFSEGYSAFMDKFGDPALRTAAQVVNAELERQLLKEVLPNSWNAEFVTAARSIKTSGFTYYRDEQVYKSDDGRVISKRAFMLMTPSERSKFLSQKASSKFDGTMPIHLTEEARKRLEEELAISMGIYSKFR